MNVTCTWNGISQTVTTVSAGTPYNFGADCSKATLTFTKTTDKYKITWSGIFYFEYYSTDNSAAVVRSLGSYDVEVPVPTFTFLNQRLPLLWTTVFATKGSGNPNTGTTDPKWIKLKTNSTMNTPLPSNVEVPPFTLGAPDWYGGTTISIGYEAVPIDMTSDITWST